MTNDTRERFTFRIPAELLEKLKNIAKRKGVTLNALILEILWNWIEQK